MAQRNNKIAIAIHGGAGTLMKGMMTPAKEAEYKKALQESLYAGYNALNSGKSAVEATELAVRIMEDCTLFNAGKGSVFTAGGKHEMDAAIMDGETLNAGAVALVNSIRNPVSLARDVMENSEHILLAADGAMEFAKKMGYSLEDPDYFYDEFRHQQWQEIRDTDQFQLDHSLKKDSKFGTVGAVACDQNANLAAATSTGGMTNKRFGRIGDSPLIGIGNYANNATCAVSCTGSGEYFIKAVTAYDLSCLIEYKGLNLEQAAFEVIHKRMTKIGGDGGLIAVDRLGNLTMPFNTEGMYRAAKDSDGLLELSIYKD
ncbi:MAG: isoaspartyl peptidase/L-asparaginase [Flavobacteriaceae bacterium]